VLVEPHADLLEEPLGARGLHDREKARRGRARVSVAVRHPGSGVNRPSDTDRERHTLAVGQTAELELALEDVEDLLVGM
jgi:hypothetical protein